ncbi:DUF7144 family membrane protein [Kitasatospora sp. NPDC004531]
MSSSAGPTPAAPGSRGSPARGHSPWVPGTVMFAGVLMLITGLLELFRGIMAVARDDVFVTTPNYIFKFDLTSWGWIHVVVGGLVALTGMCVIRGLAWARVVGVVIASVSVIDSFLAIPYYPLWSLVIIAMDVFVIWALCAYHEA